MESFVFIKSTPEAIVKTFQGMNGFATTTHQRLRYGVEENYLFPLTTEKDKKAYKALMSFFKPFSNERGIGVEFQFTVDRPISSVEDLYKWYKKRVKTIQLENHLKLEQGLLSFKENPNYFPTELQSLATMDQNYIPIWESDDLMFNKQDLAQTEKLRKCIIEEQVLEILQSDFQ